MNMEKIDRIADALGRVLETAEHHQALADRAIQTMNDTAKKLERKADELKGQINKEIQDSLSSCSSQAVDILTKKFHEADRYAEQAARRYEKAVKWAAWKVCAVATITGSSIIFSTFLLLQKTVPTYSEIRELQEKKLLLESEIVELEKVNPRIQYNYCVDGKRNRLCVKIDEEAPTYDEGWRILQGH